VIFAGYWTLGLKVGDTPDLRVIAVTSDFTGESEKDAVLLSELTALAEFDGVGYTPYDCAGVSITYDSGSHEMRIDFDSGNGDEFGTTVFAGTDPVYGFLVVVYVDGIDDVLVGFTTDGAGANSSGEAMGLSIPAGGWIFSGEA